jgi:hypothetical protein
VAGLAVGVGLGGLLQREDLLDLHLHVTGVDEFGDSGEGRAVGLDEEGSGAQPPGSGGVEQLRGDAGGDRDDQAAGAEDVPLGLLRAWVEENIDDTIAAQTP